MDAVRKTKEVGEVTGEAYREEAELEPPPLPCRGREVSDSEGEREFYSAPRTEKRMA